MLYFMGNFNNLLATFEQRLSMKRRHSTDVGDFYVFYHRARVKNYSPTKKLRPLLLLPTSNLSGEAVKISSIAFGLLVITVGGAFLNAI